MSDALTYYGSRRINLAEARGVFVHRLPRVTLNYLERHSVPFYSSKDSQQPLVGKARELSPPEIWVDVKEVERVIDKIAQSSSIGAARAAISRLEQILANQHRA